MLNACRKWLITWRWCTVLPPHKAAYVNSSTELCKCLRLYEHYLCFSVGLFRLWSSHGQPRGGWVILQKEQTSSKSTLSICEGLFPNTGGVGSQSLLHLFPDYFILMACTIQIFRLWSSPTQKESFCMEIYPTVQQFVITLIPSPSFFTFSALAAEEGEIY